MTKQIKYLVMCAIASPLLVLAFFKIKKSVKPEGEGAINESTVNDVRRKFNISNTMAAKAVEFANKLSHDLGTKYEWYNFRMWSENDKAVFDLMSNQVAPMRLKRETAYAYVLITKGRSLKNDLYTLLDEEYIKKLGI